MDTRPKDQILQTIRRRTAPIHTAQDTAKVMVKYALHQQPEQANLQASDQLLTGRLLLQPGTAHHRLEQLRPPQASTTSDRKDTLRPLQATQGEVICKSLVPTARLLDQDLQTRDAGTTRKSRTAPNRSSGQERCGQAKMNINPNTPQQGASCLQPEPRNNSIPRSC
jgi:hypothetical protein